jgi:hypothetical protein
VALLQKELRVREQQIRNLISLVIEYGAMVLMAVSGFGYWNFTAIVCWP